MAVSGSIVGHSVELGEIDLSGNDLRGDLAPLGAALQEGRVETLNLRACGLGEDGSISYFLILPSVRINLMGCLMNKSSKIMA